MTAASYTYSRKAERDLKDIFLYTAREFGLDQANKYQQGLATAAESIAVNPKLGRSCSEIGIGYHRLEYQHHILFYRIRHSDVFIVRVLHNRMDIVQHL